VGRWSRKGGDISQLYRARNHEPWVFKKN